MLVLTLGPSLLFSPAGPIWPSSPCQERGEELVRANAASDPLPAPLAAAATIPLPRVGEKHRDNGRR